MIEIELYGKKHKFQDEIELNSFLTQNSLKLKDNGDIVERTGVGCIPQILDTWFNKRAEYRKLEKKYGLAGDDEKHKFYAKRQLVQKILLNSLYGVLGLVSFRFYDLDNALAVTSSGKAIIQKTAEMGNIKYNKELGKPMILELDNGKELKLTENRKVKVNRNGELIEILAKELQETDDLISPKV